MGVELAWRSGRPCATDWRRGASSSTREGSAPLAAGQPAGRPAWRLSRMKREPARADRRRRLCVYRWEVVRRSLTSPSVPSSPSARPLKSNLRASARSPNTSW
eukprot:scaffold59438_cov26-Tisochrysis_lutea.AAC.1